MQVDVTVQDIAAGVAGSVDSCPVALAAGRCGLGPVRVGSFGLRVGRGTWFRLPRTVTEFIYAFDDGRPVVPFSFEAEL